MLRVLEPGLSVPPILAGQSACLWSMVFLSRHISHLLPVFPTIVRCAAIHQSLPPCYQERHQLLPLQELLLILIASRIVLASLLHRLRASIQPEHLQVCLNQGMRLSTQPHGYLQPKPVREMYTVRLGTRRMNTCRLSQRYPKPMNRPRTVLPRRLSSRGGKVVHLLIQPIICLTGQRLLCQSHATSTTPDSRRQDGTQRMNRVRDKKCGRPQWLKIFSHFVYHL